MAIYEVIPIYNPKIRFNIETNANVTEFETLIKRFHNHTELRQDVSRFIEWINATTKYHARILHERVKFDF